MSKLALSQEQVEDINSYLDYELHSMGENASEKNLSFGGSRNSAFVYSRSGKTKSAYNGFETDGQDRDSLIEPRFGNSRSVSRNDIGSRSLTQNANRSAIGLQTNSNTFQTQGIDTNQDHLKSYELLNIESRVKLLEKSMQNLDRVDKKDLKFMNQKKSKRRRRRRRSRSKSVGSRGSRSLGVRGSRRKFSRKKRTPAPEIIDPRTDYIIKELNKKLKSKMKIIDKEREKIRKLKTENKRVKHEVKKLRAVGTQYEALKQDYDVLVKSFEQSEKLREQQRLMIDQMKHELNRLEGMKKRTKGKKKN